MNYIIILVIWVEKEDKRKTNLMNLKKEREIKRKKVQQSGVHPSKISSTFPSKIPYKYSIPTPKLSRVNPKTPFLSLYSFFFLSLFRDKTMEVDRTANNFPDLQESSDDSSPKLAERKLRRNDSLDVESRTVPGAGAGGHAHKVHFTYLAFFLVYVFVWIWVEIERDLCCCFGCPARRRRRAGE